MALRRGGGAPAWRRPALRSAALQLGLAALLLAAAWLVVDAAMAELRRRGIATGWSFLGRAAGFDIGFTLIRFSTSDSYARAFLVGILNTLLVALLAGLLATLAGFAVGVLRLSRSWPMARLAQAYVEILRNCPLLLQLFFWYFAVLGALPTPRASLALPPLAYLNNRGLVVASPLPQEGFWLTPAAFALGGLAGFLASRRRTGRARPRAVLAGALGAAAAGFLLTRLATGAWPLAWQIPVLRGFNFEGGVVLVPELIAMVLALAIYASSYIAEIVRAGIAAVARGQVEAAAALGLPRRLVRRLVVLPQALRAIVPPLTNQYLAIVKYSSLAAAIGYPDLMQVFGKTALNHTGQAIEILTLTLAVYLAISLATAGLMHWYNGRVTQGAAGR